jgi:hypothetical protein
MKEDILGLCVVFLVLVLGGILGGSIVERKTQTAAVEHNVAFYDPKTAEFSWKTLDKNDTRVK